jgi:ABC-type polysaccharide/polyol phosphate export permease
VTDTTAPPEKSSGTRPAPRHPNEDLPVRHFDAATVRRDVWAFLFKSVDYPWLVWRHRHLVGNFFWRDLLGRFRGSFLGAGWTLVQPLFLFAVYYMVFGVLFGGKTPGQPASSFFAIWLFSGIIAFNALQDATMTGCQSVVTNGNLVKKVAFPSELLIVSPVMVGLCMHTVGLCVLVPMSLILGIADIGPAILLLPVALAIQFTLALGIGLLLSAWNVFVRDTAHLYGVVSSAWFFLSPLFYSPTLIEQRLGSTAAALFTILNPAHGLLLLHRQVFGIEEPGTIPTSLGTNLGLAVAWALLFFFFGLAVFRSRKSRFADLI